MDLLATRDLLATSTFLDWTAAPSPMWDALRWVCAVSSCLVLLPLLRIAFGRDRPEEAQGHGVVVTIRIGIVYSSLLLMQTALTEFQQIGKPLLPWRLPLVLIANGFAWWYVHRRL